MTWPAGGDRNEVLRLVQVEVLETVDAHVGQEGLGVRAFDDQLVHVVRLVEEHGGVAPGLLFAAPVGELGGDDRVDIDAAAGIAQQLDRVSGSRDHRREILIGHVRLLPNHM